MPEADKIYGKFLPETIDPGNRVCFVIEIPDTLQYRAALMGQLLWLADWRCWQHEQADYPAPPADNVAAAELFAIAVTDARFEDCGDMATCEQIIECIETDEDTQAAFNSWLLEQVTNNAAVQQALDDLASREAAVGRSLTPGQAAANLLPAELTDDCSRARLGAAMEFLVEYLDSLITDFFEVLISLDTAAKLAAKASGLIPVIGQYTQSAAEFLIELKNKIITSYAAEQTDEVKLDIAGDFFCLAEPDCDLSIDDAIGVIVERLGTIEPAEFGSIITLLTTGTFVGIQIVETAYLVALTAVKFGGKFGDAVGVQPLSVIIAQGAGVPNTFWNDYDCEVVETTVQVYSILPNFGGTVDHETAFEDGVPFEVESIAYGGVYYGVAIEADGAFELAYTISPDPVLTINPGEIVWLYNDEFDATQLAVGTASSADDLPTPVNVLMAKTTNLKGAMWTSFEPFTLTITLTAL